MEDPDITVLILEVGEFGDDVSNFLSEFPFYFPDGGSLNTSITTDPWDLPMIRFGNQILAIELYSGL